MKRLNGVAVIAALLLLAGCGGHTTTTHTPTVATTTAPAPAPPPRQPSISPVAAHPCTATSFYLQCVGAGSPGLVNPPKDKTKLGSIQLPVGAPPTAFASQFGLDFAWGGPSGSFAKANGAHFGASYLSNSSKDWNSGTLRSYLTAGLGVVFVHETSANRPLDGWNAGYDDAFSDTHEVASRYGLTKNVHVDYAADFDTTFYGTRFIPYYQGASAWMNRVNKNQDANDSAGAYGGLNTVEQVCRYGAGKLNWQTIAWSGGRRVSSSCAPLFQYTINRYWHGYSVDYNLATAANYGQVNYNYAPAIICFGPRAAGSATCRKVHAEVGRWQKAVKASRRVYKVRGCSALVSNRSKLQQRWTWFANHLHAYPRVKHATRQQALKATGRALNNARRAITGRSCLTFGSRIKFFSAEIAAVKRRYS
jgi:hypothetical protein